MDSSDDICFAAEATLGKLAKWLRILGFDTLYQPNVSADRLIDSIEKERIIITRTARIRDRNTSSKLVFITSNDPFKQLGEVITALGIIPKDIRPFSRCIRCNTPIQQLDKDSVRGMVPDYIWESHDTFQTCGRCRRIYWPGSHIKRSYDIIKRVFDRYA